MEPISTALRQLRDERGMTDTDVWAAAGISSAALSRYMHGTRGLLLDNRGARTVRRLAQVFEIDPEYFVEYRIWRLYRLARVDPRAALAAYEVAMESARLRGSLVLIERLEADLDEEA